MANDLQLRDPTTSSKPEWFERLAASTKRIENGVMILPVEAMPTAQQTDYLRIGARNLRSSLLPRPDEGQGVASAILGMLASFPAQQQSERAAEARMTAYLETLTQYPLWAVSKAISMWLGRVDESPGDNYAFPPSPPQLVRLVKLAMRPVYQRIHEYEALLAAKAEPPTPSEEQRERVAQLVGGFLKPMPGSGDAA